MPEVSPIKKVVATLSEWLDVLLVSLPSLVMAFLILLLFYFLAKYLSKFFDRYVARHFDSQTIAQLLSFIIKIVVNTLGVVASIGILGLHKVFFSILAGAGIAGLAIGFAFKEIATNILSGIILSVKKPFRIGHLIRINNYFGEVLRLELRTTTLRGLDETMIVVPNKEILENTLINFSQSGILRKKIEVSIAYEDEIDKAACVIKEALLKLDFIKKERGVDVFAQEFESSGIKLSVRFWYYFPHSLISFRESEHLAICSIKKALQGNGVTIPFPIRTLDFSSKSSTAFAKTLKQ